MDATPDTKTRTKCNEEKPLDQFGKISRNGERRRPACKACAILAKHKWQQDNPEKTKAYRDKWRETHPIRVSQDNRNYRQKYPEKICAKNAGRRAASLKRIPPWADKKAIQEVYRQARALEEATGIPYHVDHIVPLQGDDVSGLHVDYNLRAVPARVNLTKSNSFDPDA